MLLESEKPSSAGRVPFFPRSWPARILQTSPGIKVLCAGLRRPYTFELLSAIPPWLQFTASVGTFNAFHAAQKARRGRNLLQSLLWWLLPLWLLQCLGFTLVQFLTSKQADCLKGLIRGAKSADHGLYQIAEQAGRYFALCFFKAYVALWSATPVIENTCRVEAVVHGLYFDKLARMDLAEAARVNLGTIKDGLALDLPRLSGTVGKSHEVVSTTFGTLLCLVLITRELRWVGLAGFGVFIAVSFLHYGFVRLLFRLLRRKLGLADARVKFLTSVLVGMRAVKLNLWEGVVARRLDDLRREELRITRLIIFGRGAIDAVFSALPLLTTLFFVAMARDGFAKLDIADLFTIITRLNSITPHIRAFVFSLITYAESWAALQRVAAFNALPDAESAHDAALPPGHLRLEGAGIRPAPGAAPLLAGVELALRPGELVAVVGAVGSGKSTLLKACISAAPLAAGTLRHHGRLAYVPQESFLINASLRENVTFGLAFDAQLYAEVVALCELSEDIAALPAGDETEIGERGANLSGGQRQRVSIARAVYSRADIYIVDDCLSAVDNRVGEAIFRRVFAGKLREKTVLVATHALRYLPAFDRICVLEAGRVAFDGTYAQLAAGPLLGGVQPPAELVAEAAGPGDAGPARPPSAGAGQGGKLVRAEHRFEGLVGLDVYVEYFRRGGWLYLALNLLVVALSVAARLAGERWTTRFCKKDQQSISFARFTAVYAAIVGAFLATLLLRSALYSDFSRRVSHRIFSEFIAQLLRKRLAFFDTTPVGRLTNLASRDTDIVDLYLAMSLIFALANLFHLAGIIVLNGLASLVAVVPIVAALGVFGLVAYAFMRVGVELRRLSQLATGPVLSSLAELHLGLSSFRVYGQVGFHARKYAQCVDRCLAVSIHDRHLTAFVSFAIDLVAGAAATATFVVIAWGRARHWRLVSADEETIAHSLTGVTGVLGLLPALFGFLAEGTARNMSAVQRLMHQLDSAEEEPPQGRTPLRAGWPSSGLIEAAGLAARYRPGLPRVLNALTFRVRSGEKVGVIGRTGSGKSSLLLALTRLLEAEEGSLSIGGVELRELSPAQVRSAFAVVPQDPFCFDGSLRFNVDPAGRFSDEQIIAALRKVGLGAGEVEAPGGRKEDALALSDAAALDVCVEEGGKSLSGGKRQLLCIARAILARPRILVLDEATSSLDPRTDDAVQEVIRKEFADTTVITIAHRLNTVMGCDQLLVMNNGQIIACGHPRDLISKGDLANHMQVPGQP